MRSDRRTVARWATWWLACGLVAWLAAAATVANDAPIADGAQVASMETVCPPAAAAMSVPELGHTVGTDRLDSYRGGTQDPYQTVNEARLSGTVSDNAATNVATGSNIVRDGSSVSASRIPTVIQSSGANVLIQNATTANVQFRP